MKSLNSAKYNLKKISDYDFGQYLHLVESNVYEVETVVSRANKLIRKNKNRFLFEILKTAVGFISVVGCPLILISMFISGGYEGVVELSLYFLWFCVGCCFSRSFIKKINYAKKNREDNNLEINIALKKGIEYGLIVVNAFFDKNEQFENIFQDMSENEIQLIGSGLGLLEFDLTTFEEIAYKNQKCNEKPVILDENYYLDGRELSKKYLVNFYKNRLISF